MKTPEVSSRTRVGSIPQQQVRFPSVIIDRDLTVFREGLRWSFAGGKVLINGQDLNHFVTQDSSEVAQWMGLAQGLDEYRKKVLKEVEESDQLAKFEAVVAALLGKILGRVKKVYDQKLTGLSWSLAEGQFVLNGINIRSFLALYRVRKTDKAKKFLKSLRGKLSMLLENHQQSPDYERVHEVVQQLCEEIDTTLSSEASSRSPHALPLHHSGVS